MPHAVVIHCAAREPGDPLLIHGGQLQGAFLSVIRQVDPALALDLHGGNVLRGYALSLLKSRGCQDKRRGFKLRLACLDDRIYPAVARWAIDPPGQSSTIKLARHDFQVIRVLVTAGSGEPWAGYVTFEDLTGRASDSDTVIPIEFYSPVCFAQGPVDEPVPLARHIFGGLARRWNTVFGDRLRIPIGEDLGGGFLRMVEDHVVLAHPFEFRSAVADVGDGRKLTGFVGRATYRITGRPIAPFVYLINLLADAAFYMGLGKKTSRGCGAIRRLPDYDSFR